jgi:hypothetical protein
LTGAASSDRLGRVFASAIQVATSCLGGHPPDEVLGLVDLVEFRRQVRGVAPGELGDGVDPIGARRAPAPAPDVDLRALHRTGPSPDVDAEALRRPATPVAPPAGRRRRVLVAATSTLVVLLAAGGFWWRHEVTADPGLELSGGLNVARDESGTDRGGIAPLESQFRSERDEVAVDFVPNGRLHATVVLHNGGDHDVRIEGFRPGRYYYWGLEHISVSDKRDGGSAGFAAPYEPLRPFTLQRGETRELRLDFRLADCDPASLKPGGYSTLLAVGFRYRILGISRTVDVPFGDTVISLQAMGECAHPMTEPDGTRS